MRTLLILLAGGLVTWVFRVAFIALVPSGHPPAAVSKALRHAAPAAFAALLAVSISDAATSSGQLHGWPVLAATAVTALAARKSRNVPLVLLTGVLAVTAFTQI